MSTILKIVKMDLVMCRKSLIIMTVGMIAAGIACLFLFTPILLGLFAVGATAVVSAVFAVESKSNMGFFYGCMPIRRREYIIARNITCFLVLAVSSVISIIFVLISMNFSLCQIEEIKAIIDLTKLYQMHIIFAMIMLGLVGGANLLFVSFVGKIESREIYEVILLIVEAVIAGLIFVLVQIIGFNNDIEKFLSCLNTFLVDNKAGMCIIMVLIGIAFLVIESLVSIKVLNSSKKERI
ncbi:MAG: ABC-2 transporter permease [Acutalibacteraceae bacterium]